MRFMSSAISMENLLKSDNVIDFMGPRTISYGNRRC